MGRVRGATRGDVCRYPGMQMAKILGRRLANLSNHSTRASCETRFGGRHGGRHGFPEPAFGQRGRLRRGRRGTRTADTADTLDTERGRGATHFGEPRISGRRRLDL